MHDMRLSAQGPGHAKTSAQGPGHAITTHHPAYSLKHKMSGPWDSFLGLVPLEVGGLAMVRVPVVMGEPPVDKLQTLEAWFRAPRGWVLRLCSSYRLCLHMPHVYASPIASVSSKW